MYTLSVLSYINYCVDNVTVSKRIRVYPNEKPWVNSEVKRQTSNSVARANLKRGIRSAKHKYKLRIEEDFNSNSNPQRMWQGIQSITDYKNNTQQSPANNTANLLEEINNFFAQFDKDNNQPPVSFQLLCIVCCMCMLCVCVLGCLATPQYTTTP